MAGEEEDEVEEEEAEEEEEEENFTTDELIGLSTSLLSRRRSDTLYPRYAPFCKGWKDWALCVHITLY